MSVLGLTGSSASSGMQNSSVQDSSVNDLCQAVSKCKISDTPRCLIALPMALITKVISFGSLRDKGRVAATCKRANTASQSALAFEGYGDRALCESLQKLNYPVHNRHFVKWFIHLGPKMNLFKLTTRVSRDRLVLLRNYMTNIQEAHLGGVSRVSTLRRFVQTWPHLERLDLTRFSYFSPECFAHIASCSKLKTLGLPQRVSDNDLVVLKPVIQKLEVLKVYGFTFSIRGWSLLATECSNLRALQVYDDNRSTVKSFPLSTEIARMQKVPHAKEAMYDIFLEAYFNHNEFENAARMLAEMKREGFSFTNFFLRQIEADRVNQAERLLQEARKEGIRPNSAIYNALINAHLQRGKLLEAESVLKGMQSIDCRLDKCTYEALIFANLKACCKFDEAERLFDEMWRVGHRLDEAAFNKLFIAFIEAGGPETAENMLKKMRSEGIIRPDEVTFNKLFIGYVKVGRPEAAERILEEMRSHGFPPNVHNFNLLIHGYAKAKRDMEVERVLKDMRSQGISPNEATFAVTQMLDKNRRKF